MVSSKSGVAVSPREYAKSCRSISRSVTFPSLNSNTPQTATQQHLRSGPGRFALDFSVGPGDGQ